jgi:hypothetical protein
VTSEATKEWCAARGHPFVTFNSSLNRTYCRCGQRQQSGELPMDWAAKRGVFHNCEPASPCRCYATERPTPA